MKFSIVIPCYNEEDNIALLLDAIVPMQEKYDLEYVLVENGSTDGSKNYFKQFVENKYNQIKIVYVDENKGYGYGIQQGLKEAKGNYIGWIHADLQISPDELPSFFDSILSENDEKTKKFLKGRRTNRSIFDRFFTNGQALFNSVLFGKKLFDIGAVPVLFESSLIKDIDILPNDFSIELYVYLQAKRRHFKVERYKVRLHKRNKGISSWNTGLQSKIKLSKKIILDSIKIKRGEKVL